MVSRVRSLAPSGVTLLVLTLLVITCWAWARQEPSVKPADIRLHAVLRAPGKAMNPLPGQEDQWTLEITLDKTVKRPLYVSDGQWFFQVTPYVPGMSVPVWDFFQGLTSGTSGSVVGGHGYSMGFDGRHVPMVVAALRARGEAVTDREIQTFTAFGYVGNEFPTRVRYYLAGKGFDAGRRQAFVVYTHYEKRWGKDLSWTAVFPADLDQ